MKIITFILFAFFFSVAVAVYSMIGLPHEFTNNDCTICHTGPTAKPSTKTGGSVTKMCLTCHTDLYDEGYMHPVDIKPKKVRVPFDFPLSQSGKLTCNTCHDPHTPYETPFGTKSHFLRRYEQGKAFCDICHINSLGIATGHGTVFRKAHHEAKYTETYSTNSIDSLSRECISCHDGSFSSSVQVKVGTWQHSTNFVAFDKGGMHPIGSSYTKIQANNHKASLRPISQVDKRIRFFGEKDTIGCGSCHDPYKSTPNKLIMSNDKSRLCFSCHKM